MVDVPPSVLGFGALVTFVALAFAYRSTDGSARSNGKAPEDKDAFFSSSSSSSKAKAKSRKKARKADAKAAPAPAPATSAPLAEEPAAAPETTRRGSILKKKTAATDPESSSQRSKTSSNSVVFGDLPSQSPSSSTPLAPAPAPAPVPAPASAPVPAVAKEPLRPNGTITPADYDDDEQAYEVEEPVQPDNWQSVGGKGAGRTTSKKTQGGKHVKRCCILQC